MIRLTSRSFPLDPIFMFLSAKDGKEYSTKINIFILVLYSFPSFADKNMKIGSKGKERDVNRIIKVKMYDNYYEPSSFQIKAGETIKFEVENVGELVHEFNILNSWTNSPTFSTSNFIVSPALI